MGSITNSRRAATSYWERSRRCLVRPPAAFLPSMPANASSAAPDRRVTDPRREIRVHVAELVAATGGMLVTIGLGSCVAIALYDPEAHVAGLAHVLLPSEN